MGVILKNKKRIEKFLNASTELMYKEVEWILIYFGFQLKNIEGDHHIFKNVSCTLTDTALFVIPTISGSKVKKCYIVKIAKTLGLNEWYQLNENKL